ncbi:MAG: hypothetical protein JWO35_652 [Candidatus Saccharibacteria bacterium]|nr:hypothetical protein [Candidatus Saccharibacteria bacterium]
MRTAELEMSNQVEMALHADQAMQLTAEEYGKRAHEAPGHLPHFGDASDTALHDKAMYGVQVGSNEIITPASAVVLAAGNANEADHANKVDHVVMSKTEKQGDYSVTIPVAYQSDTAQTVIVKRVSPKGDNFEASIKGKNAQKMGAIVARRAVQDIKERINHREIDKQAKVH